MFWGFFPSCFLINCKITFVLSIAVSAFSLQLINYWVESFCLSLAYIISCLSVFHLSVVWLLPYYLLCTGRSLIGQFQWSSLIHHIPLWIMIYDIASSLSTSVWPKTGLLGLCTSSLSKCTLAWSFSTEKQCFHCFRIFYSKDEFHQWRPRQRRH